MTRLLFALAAALLAAIFALLPVEQQTTEYAWEPASDGSHVPLLLIERTPDEFELRFPCELADGAMQQLFVSSRSPETVPALFVHAGESRVVVEVPEHRDDPAGERTSTGVEVATTADCGVLVEFERATGRLAVGTGDATAAIDVADDAFEVTGLHWTQSANDAVHAEVRTSAFAMIRNSAMQKLALGAVVLVALGSLLALVVGGWRWRPRAGWWRPSPSEWSMLALAVLVALVDLPRVDDGRILGRARLLAGIDLNANVPVLIENTILPQRWLYEWVLGNTVAGSSIILVVRSVSILAMVGAWVLLRRRVLPSLVRGPAPHVIAAAWAVHATFVVAWSATLRPEPLVVALTAVVLAVTATWPAEPRSWPYALVVGAVGLAVATHVAGLTVAFAALPAAWRAVGELRHSPVPVLTGVTWGGAASVVSLFLGTNLQHTIHAVTSFREDLHDHGVLDVLLYVSTIENSTAPMMLATGLTAIGMVTTLAVAFRGLQHRMAWPSDAVIMGAALSPFGLLFTPSKWLWHLAVLAPVAVVGWSLVIRHLDRRRAPSVARLLIVGGLLGLAMAWAMRPVWSQRMLTRWWRDTSLREVTTDAWAERFPWLAGPGVRWWIWLLLLWVVIVTARLVVSRHGRNGDSAAIAMSLLACVAATSLVQLTPPVLDALRTSPEWTFTRQSVAGLISKEASCGVPAATPALSQHTERSNQPDLGVTEGRIAGHSGVYMYAPCHQPMRQHEGVWHVPPLLMGDLTHSQPRVLLEYEASSIGCNSFPRPRARDRLCFFELLAQGEPLVPSYVHWSTTDRSHALAPR